MIPLLIATRSPGKLREIHEILSSASGFDLLTLETAGLEWSSEEEGIETHPTFDANARAKAEYYASRSGLPVLADDSGLCVDALNGAPGVSSKRFSGRSDLAGPELDAANNALLLDRLRGTPEHLRGASYRCTIAIFAPETGHSETVEGSCSGVILSEARGERGFGYDPLFYIPAERRTFAELPAARKNQLSHRAAALRATAPVLDRWRASGVLPHT